VFDGLQYAGEEYVMEVDTIQELLRYNTWANARMLDAVEVLDSGQFTRALGGSYSSVQGTLTHMVWAEWVWLERWKGGSPKQLFSAEEFPTVSDVRARWLEIQASQEAFGETLTAQQLARVLRYTNRREEVWEYALWRMIHHLCNHSTYHRGQVTNMLRMLGAQPAATDFLVFWDEGGEARRRTRG
jgi:uncharacterized damage-inducible protein DinB